MPSLVYNQAKQLFLNGGLDLDTDDIRCLLVTSAYVEDADHDFVAAITNELSGGGYVRKTLTGEVVTLVDASDWAFFDCNDPVWLALAAAAGNPHAIVFYKHVTNDADSPLISYNELTAPPIPNGGDYTVNINASGVLRLA